MSHVTRLLETNSYVRYLLIDFSKAFDVVDHGILAAKLSGLNIPPAILSWIFSFLTGRTQQVKYGYHLSSPKPINRGIVQGSGLGPTLYIIMEDDLRALSNTNLLFKYADDTNLLVPEISDVDINDEFNNVRKWADDNRMILNLRKTKEIVFHRPSARYSLPSLVTGIEQVVSAKLLGVTFSHNLKFDEHVKNILTICNQRSYLLKCLKGQGLPSKELHIVFCALIVSRILYALPAWGGFLTADLIAKIDAYLYKAIRWGYNGNLTMLSELLHDADMKLFRSMLRSTHCIHQLLPPLKFMPMKLRTSHCPFALPYTATITSTNIHLFYCVFLMEHINCLCCCLTCSSLLFIFHAFPCVTLRCDDELLSYRNIIRSHWSSAESNCRVYERCRQRHQ